MTELLSTTTHREYVITAPTRPALDQLPRHRGLLRARSRNTAGGYSFYRDARLRRLTRYRYNNAPLDAGGRYFYLRDDGRRRLVARAGSRSRRDLDDYECRHGLGYTRSPRRRAGSAPRRCSSCRPARRSRSGGRG